MNERTLFIGSNGHVAAIDVETGEELWRTKLGGTGIFSSTAYADVCILEHESRVFAGAMGHLFCLDARNGEVLWRNDLKGMGHNDVTLAMAGKSIQFVATVSRQS
jgi:outer membrane protein assembly factor BamB